MSAGLPPAGAGPSYRELIEELFPRLTGGIRWGTGRTERLLASVGDPHRRFRALHVGGTNGKGSVSAMLASVLGGTHPPVGLYTSPHLCAFRERIQIGGVPVSEAALERAASRLWPAIQEEGASFFEATTALAFEVFAEAAVPVAVVEVGLGGRLDATNVVDPVVSVITNVAVDHAEYLGTTLESVAREKAGIVKAGVPLVTAERDPAILDLLRRRAAAVGAPFHPLDVARISDVHVDRAGTRFRLRRTPWGDLDVRVPLIGPHQAVNAALAIHALSMLDESLRPSRDAVLEGLRRVRWPGRFQWVELGGRDWILDVAHNPAGIEALGGAIGTLPVSRPLTAVVGILADKDWRAMLAALAGIADRIVLTSPPSAPPHRRWDPVVASGALPPGSAVVVPELADALEFARAGVREGTILVTGSFHTVGDAMSLLGLAPWGASGCDEPVGGAHLPVPEAVV